MIALASATRLTKVDFWHSSALGISLQRLAHDRRLAPHLAFENRRGLSEVYNAVIRNTNCELIVFIHDDVWIDDFYFADRVSAGLLEYDVVGVAGNRRRVPCQPAWAFVDEKLTWDDKAYLSGAIAHGHQPFGCISFFGDTPAECELLDGVFLAAKVRTLRERSVFFDPCFDFNFYDVDFCRTSRKMGLRLGTWPISLTHQSDGAFGSKQWFDKYSLYVKKWGS